MIHSDASKKVLLIGVGNDFRSDDAIGCIVADQIQLQNIKGLDVIKTSGRVSLMEAWKKYSQVILIDAAQSGKTPGTLHRFEAHKRVLPHRLLRPTSTHALGVFETIELARQTGELPPYLIVYGVEGKNFGQGKELSPEIKQTLPQIIKSITQETRSLFSA